MSIIGQEIDRLGLTLLVAAVVHAFVILGITFKPLDPNRPDHRQQSLEILVVEQPIEPLPKDEKADFLAQTSQQGSGDESEVEEPEFEQSFEPLPLPQQIQQTPPLPIQEERPRLVTETATSQTLPEPPPEEAAPIPSANQLLNSKDIEIARVTAELQRKTQAYAKMLKGKAISASTKEYKYAAYLDAWRRKVERIGNLNYPDQAKRDRLYGNLVLHVAVRADGSVERVRVLHSSGHKILDDAAVRIVRMSAPFSPFPAEIRKEADVFDITRTWQFLRSGKFDSQ
jgi:protein TonB